MRSIHRAELEAVLDRVSRRGADWNEGEINVAIFRLFDDRELRRQPRLIDRFVEEARPPDPTGLYDALRAIEPRVYDDWAIVDPYVYVDNDYRDEAPPEAFQQLLGYNDADGNFVPMPELRPLPKYCSSVEDARALKIQAFGSFLFLQWREVTGEWGFDYEAALLTESGEVLSSFRSEYVALAIVGAVLLGMASGWTHHLAYFQVVG
jgi:hypothetical protein